MTPILAQIKAPPERIYGIRDSFVLSDTFVDLVFAFFGVVLVLAIGFLILRVVHRRQHRRVYHPRKLLGEMLRATGLSAAERDLLRHIARELRLSHPAILLLSPHVFHSHANRWMSVTRAANTQTRARLDRLAAALFSEAPVDRAAG